MCLPEHRQGRGSTPGEATGRPTHREKRPGGYLPVMKLLEELLGDLHERKIHPFGNLPMGDRHAGKIRSGGRLPNVRGE